MSLLPSTIIPDDRLQLLLFLTSMAAMALFSSSGLMLLCGGKKKSHQVTKARHHRRIATNQRHPKQPATPEPTTAKPQIPAVEPENNRKDDDDDDLPMPMQFELDPKATMIREQGLTKAANEPYPTIDPDLSD